MPTPTYFPIATATGNGSSTAISLTGLGGYKNLYIRAYYTFTSAGNLIYINGSGTSVTHDQIVLYNGLSSATLQADPYCYLNQGGNLVGTTDMGIANIYIPNYGSTSTFKSYNIESQYDNNFNMSMIAGVWKSTTAITSITFEAGTAFTNLSKFTAFGMD
jgi:hypothetical protein